MKIKFKEINKYFGSAHILKDIDLTVNSGRIFGYLGRNGAGKTTSFRILMDVFKADSGSILMDGKPFDPQVHRIGYLPEERGMYSKTRVIDQLLYFAMLRGADKKSALLSIERWAKRFQIEEYLPRKLETLSKGNQQKVQIAQAFINEPDILILDEPFSGLDPVNSSVFQTALSEYIDEGKIIIFSSHQMSYVEQFCDDIALIHQGKIVMQGALDAILDEYGQGKLRLAVKELSSDELHTWLAQENYRSEEDGRSVIVDLMGTQRNELVRKLVDLGMEIQLLADYRPSLQEVFVALAGEEHA